MTEKIKIKLGQIEVEYEGSEEFIKQGLLDLVRTVSGIFQTVGIPTSPFEAPTLPPPGSSTPQDGLQLSSGTIAAKLKCASGPDLIIAAAASLTITKKQDTFTRQQIVDEMKAASAYFKASYVSNLTQNLNNVIKSNKLLENAQGRYALSATCRKELEDHLAI